MDPKDERESLLAADYMKGWQVKIPSERHHLGVLAASHRHAGGNFSEMARLSLLNGVQEWDMVVACAESLRRNHIGNNELAGQDLLTFLAKVITPTPEVQQENTEDVDSGDARQGSGSAATIYPKKRKRGFDSHYFEKHDTKAARKNSKKAKRRDRRNQLRGEEDQQGQDHGGPDPVSPPSAASLLQEAPSSFRSENNVRRSKIISREDEETARISTEQLPDSVLETSSSLKIRTQINSQGATGGIDRLSNGIQQQQEVAQTGNLPVIAPSPPPSPPDDDGEVLKASMPRVDTVVQSIEATSGLSEARRYSLRSASRTPKRRSTSHYFETPKSTPRSSTPLKPKSPRPPRGTVSSLPFPPLSRPSFGLAQEKLANDPFRLLIAVTFLIRTPGRVAMPTFRTLMDKYPTPEALANAQASDITAMTKHLGLSIVRTAQIQKYARIWLEHPPAKDTRYGVKNYPKPGNGTDVRAGETLPPEEEDQRTSAWEIGHMTQGAYAIDSWRIFCRDALLGRAQDWKGEGREGEFQPEWMRVLPMDKELRAYLRWMWMREGWNWDPLTGDREVLSEELREAVNGGRVAWDNTGALKIVETNVAVDDEKTAA